MVLFNTAWPKATLRYLDNISALTWLRLYCLPPPLFSFVAALLNLFFVVPLDRLPASEAVLALREIYWGGAGRYHAGGFGSIAEQAAEYVASHGGVYIPKARVEKIIIEAGAVRGVATTRGVFRAPIVISNAGIQPTVLKLAGTEHFSRQYIESVRRLEPSWAFVGVRYHLNAAVFDVPMTVVFSNESWWDYRRFERAREGCWPTDPLLFVTVPSLYDRTLTPQRSNGVVQVALLGTLCSADPSSPMNKEAIAQTEQLANRLWPQLQDQLVRREVYTARDVSRLSRDGVVSGQGGECIGIGQLIGQCGGSKPNPQTPVRGLFFVGCDAGGRGIGTHQAVDSGFVVSSLVLEWINKTMGRTRTDQTPLAVTRSH